jgi:hypothetical protein
MKHFNYKRRAIGSLICLFPLILCVVSFSVAEQISWKNKVGQCATFIGFPIALLNIVLVLFRPTWHRIRFGREAPMRNVSGIGLMSSLLVTMGNLFSFGDTANATWGMVILLLDPIGLPWLLILTWRDSGMWDGEPIASQETNAPQN